ncbi:c-type cytochrome [Uliginosibacterium sp. H1]|uniref:c-type cytochrome n=1 Tax=Uliginosibacterium sp. H1 TaxID=3114757 RepID=UPI002E1817BA|nr:c-type cytochrome [Uliginosibacterium sp. H1]
MKSGAAALCIPFCVLLAACHQQGVDSHAPRYTRVAGANPERGARLLEQYQCGSCHLIPEVPSATDGMGPTLASYGRRSYIAGHIPNTPDTLVAWLQQPSALLPGTLMPDSGVSQADARDMAAYLMSLQ